MQAFKKAQSLSSTLQISIFSIQYSHFTFFFSFLMDLFRQHCRKSGVILIASIFCLWKKITCTQALYSFIWVTCTKLSIWCHFILLLHHIFTVKYYFLLHFINYLILVTLQIRFFHTKMVICWKRLLIRPKCIWKFKIAPGQQKSVHNTWMHDVITERNTHRASTLLSLLILSV